MVSLPFGTSKAGCGRPRFQVDSAATGSIREDGGYNRPLTSQSRFLQRRSHVKTISIATTAGLRGKIRRPALPFWHDHAYIWAVSLTDYGDKRPMQ